MNPLVGPEWLADRLSDSNVIVVDATMPPVGVVPPVDTRARYLAHHIPGAVFFDIDELSDHSTDLPHTLPSAEMFGKQMAELGISDNAAIVVYEQDGVYSAPRAWWMLRSFGAKDVHLLDGGLRGWLESGFPAESGEVRRAVGSFKAKLDPEAVKTLADVRQMLGGRGQIADARSAGRFAGTLPEPRPGLSSGHMPGSFSVPFTELAEDGRLRSAEALRVIFESKGIDIERPVTTSCGSGVTAAVVLVGLEVAGAKRVSLYDGSWAEYARQPDAVIEKDA
jgi:thiosulfate/3-mercaptopyruvate sulfurtransferase